MEHVRYPGPIHDFLNRIEQSRSDKEQPSAPRILDCGAGGETPPLGLFFEHGFDTQGIDISNEQIEQARAFAKQHTMDLNIQKGDMRRIPFDDEYFDYVYEYHSICHLTKADTRIAIGEMMRVLKKGGLCFLGFMGIASWPILGKRVGKNEFRLIEGGPEVVHSAYEDGEPDTYFSDWKILQREKHTRWFMNWSAQLSKEDWAKWFDEERTIYSRAEWDRMYADRIARGNSTHVFYTIQKPK